MTSCPCGSGRPLADCCQPVIDGTPALTAEALMRARYTAFLEGRMDFLDATLAPEKRDGVDADAVAEAARDAQGLGLVVRAVNGGGPDDDEGEVEYLARFRIKGQMHGHHELASFRREGGAWVYVDGEMNPRQEPRQVGAKPGRNDPCPCGSGKKYKKCCGA